MSRKKIEVISDKNQTRLPSYTDRTKFKYLNKTSIKNNKFKLSKNRVQGLSSRSELEKLNPFFKEIDRHYGSFKARARGNFKKLFEELDWVELAPLGRSGTGCRRKLCKNKNYAVLFFENGTVEIRPSRDKGLNPRSLQSAFYDKARLAVKFLEERGFFFDGLVLNRLPKYGVEDKTARLIAQEFQGEFRGMDKSPRHGHIDNKGVGACVRDSQLSSDEHFKLAQARLENPELFAGLNEKVDFVVDAQVDFAKNLKLHLKAIRDLSRAARAIEKNVKGLRGASVGIQTPRARFPTNFKRSATLRGVN